jgi:hypothetical protein
LVQGLGLIYRNANEKAVMSDYDPRDGRKTAAIILLGLAGYIVLSRSGLLEFFGIGQVLGWVFRTVRGLIPAAILALGIYWLIQNKDGEKPIIAWFLTFNFFRHKNAEIRWL